MRNARAVGSSMNTIIAERRDMKAVGLRFDIVEKKEEEKKEERKKKERRKKWEKRRKEERRKKKEDRKK